jgi:hypothetical protein
MVVWVGGAGSFIANTGTVTVTLPAFNAGDLAILVVGNDDATDPAYPTPSGWTFRGNTAATNMHSYIFSRVLQVGDVSVSITVPASRTGTAAVGIWRDAVWNSMGSFGIRSGSSNTVTAPGHPTATGARAHIFSDRSVAAAAGEADTLPTALAYGTARYFYPGNTTLGASTGICAVYFADSASGSGANTATLADSSGNAWGLQVDIQGTSGVSHARSADDSLAVLDGLTVSRNMYQSGDSVGLTALPPDVVKALLAHSRSVSDDIGMVESLAVARNIYQPGDNVGLVAQSPNAVKNLVTSGRTVQDSIGLTDSLRVTRNKYQSGDRISISDAGRALRTVETIPSDPMSITGDPAVSRSGPPETGRPKVFIGGVTVSKPAKVYIGGTWVEKPMKRHNGTTWVLVR